MNDSDSQQALWLTLARAFLPPKGAALAHAFRHDLAADLDEMATHAELDVARHVGAMRKALHACGDDAALLIHYSRLFLVPPLRAHLNVGLYLDGAVNGTAVGAIEYLQGAYGIARLATFHSLPDHLSCLLELLAVLGELPEAEADRVQLVRRFLLPGLAWLCQAISSESDIDSPYLHLARLAAAALRQTVPAHEQIEDARRNKRRQARHDLDKGIWRNCAGCGKPYAREKELQIMAKALQAHKLAIEHLGVCPDCRPHPAWAR